MGGPVRAGDGGWGTASVLTEGAGTPITAAGQRRTRFRTNPLPTGLSSLPPGRDPLEPLFVLCSRGRHPGQSAAARRLFRADFLSLPLAAAPESQTSGARR